MPGEIIKYLEGNILKVCKDVNSDDLCNLFLNCQAKILAGLHGCVSMDMDNRLSFKFEEFPLIKRTWIIKDRHSYFQTVVTLQSFKGEVFLVLDFSQESKSHIIKKIFFWKNYFCVNKKLEKKQDYFIHLCSRKKVIYQKNYLSPKQFIDHFTDQISSKSTKSKDPFGPIFENAIKLVEQDSTPIKTRLNFVKNHFRTATKPLAENAGIITKSRKEIEVESKTLISAPSLIESTYTNKKGNMEKLVELDKAISVTNKSEPTSTHTTKPITPITANIPSTLKFPSSMPIPNSSAYTARPWVNNEQAQSNKAKFEALKKEKEKKELDLFQSQNLVNFSLDKTTDLTKSINSSQQDTPKLSLLDLKAQQTTTKAPIPVPRASVIHANAQNNCTTRPRHSTNSLSAPLSDLENNVSSLDFTSDLMSTIDDVFKKNSGMVSKEEWVKFD